MEIEDFFENKQKHHRNGQYRNHQDSHSSYGHDKYHSDEHEDYNHSGQRGSYNHDGYRRSNYGNVLLPLFEKARSNPKLKFMLIAAAILVLVSAVVIITALFPLILKIIDDVSKSGIQGIISSILKG